MAKKYLLYIHHPQFVEQVHKSALIRSLLDYYYSQPSKQIDMEKPGKTFIPRPPNPDTGYPCCVKAAPCKHWTYDGDNGVWRNTLTNKTREVATDADKN